MEVGTGLIELDIGSRGVPEQVQLPAMERPASEMELTELIIEGEPLDVHTTTRTYDGRGIPRLTSVVSYDHLSAIKMNFLRT